MMGEWEKALDCYEKAEEYHLAGELCLRLGHKEVAAEWFLLSNEKLRAAELYERAGDAREAANLRGDERLSGGDALAAAEAVVRGGDLVRAAEAFESAGRFERASECYEKSEAPFARRPRLRFAAS